MIVSQHIHRLIGGIFYCKSLRRLVRVIDTGANVDEVTNEVRSVVVSYSSVASPWLSSRGSRLAPIKVSEEISVEDLSTYFRSGFYNGRAGLVLLSLPYGERAYKRGIRSSASATLLSNCGASRVSVVTELYSWDLSVLDGYPPRNVALNLCPSVFDDDYKRIMAYAVSPYVAIIGKDVALAQNLNGLLREEATKMNAWDLIAVDPRLSPLCIFTDRLEYCLGDRTCLLDYNKYGEAL